MDCLLNDPAPVTLPAEPHKVAFQPQHQFPLLVGSSDLEELLNHKIRKDIASQPIGHWQYCLQYCSLLLFARLVQPCLQITATMLILCELKDVRQNLLKWELGPGALLPNLGKLGTAICAPTLRGTLGGLCKSCHPVTATLCLLQ